MFFGRTLENRAALGLSGSTDTHGTSCGGGGDGEMVEVVEAKATQGGAKKRQQER